MAYNGIKIEGTVDHGSDPIGSFDFLAHDVMWFRVPRSHLGVGSTHKTDTPAELIRFWYGDSLVSSTDGESGSSAGEGASFATEYYTWRRTTTIAHMVTAVIAFLPPISSLDDKTISGFLDWYSPWGLVYDADVLYKNITEAAALAQLTAGAVGADGLDATIASALLPDSWLSPSTVENESMYPKAAYTALYSTTTGWYQHAGDEDEDDLMSDQTDPWNLATTYGLEAIGYDAYNEVDGAETGYATLDANESLHSNELFRWMPSSADGTEWENDPQRSHVMIKSSYQELKWQYSYNTRQVFAGAYHATYQSDDSATHRESGLAWRKTHEQELKDMSDDVDSACTAISLLMETTEFPKRLINHIQRKGKIPNNFVSAFGYVPEEMYTVGATDTYTFGADDTISYDPVTGEPMDMDATWGYASSAITWEGEARGADASRYTNVEGWADDGTGGAGESDTGTDRPDGVDATRYEGWDD